MLPLASLPEHQHSRGCELIKITQEALIAVCFCEVSSAANSEAPTRSFTTDLLLSWAAPITRNLLVHPSSIHIHPPSTSSLPPHPAFVQGVTEAEVSKTGCGFLLDVRWRVRLTPTPPVSLFLPPERSMPTPSNGTLADTLTRALGRYLDAWRRNASAAADALDKTLLEENFVNVEWYLAVMIGMFAFIVVAMLVSTVKSKRREHSNDPYHKYIEGEWTEKTTQGYTNDAAG
ncbi:unnamed protein product [Arctogadus glacialis]